MGPQGQYRAARSCCGAAHAVRTAHNGRTPPRGTRTRAIPAGTLGIAMPWGRCHWAMGTPGGDPTIAWKRHNHGGNHLRRTLLRGCASQCAAGTKWEAVVGVETHVQLNTATKAFCACRNAYGDPPNTNICPVCLGHPGMLPVLNSRAVSLAAVTGFALNCKVHGASQFDRKQYFYGDLPKGYQISQNDQPLSTNGWVDVPLYGTASRPGEAEDIRAVRVRIHRVHLEEDTAKMTHHASRAAGSTSSLVDFNRAGVPLVEIVTDPDLRTGEEAAAFAAELRRIVRFLGTSSGNMEQGSLRCDINISIREKQSAEEEEADGHVVVRRPAAGRTLGTRVEVKNLNSLSAIRSAVDYEFSRQTQLILDGKKDNIVQETRFWDENKQETIPGRRKEKSEDYRYIREPDLALLRIPEEQLSSLSRGMPELPWSARRRYSEELGLAASEVQILCDDPGTVRYFDEAVEHVNSSSGGSRDGEGSAAAPSSLAREAAKWLVGDVAALIQKKGFATVGESKLTPQALAQLATLVRGGAITGKIAKQDLPTLVDEGGMPSEVVASRGLAPITDEDELGQLVRSVMDAHPKQVTEFRHGKDKLFGFFVGQVMKQSNGRADPEKVNPMLREMLRNEEPQ